jgi:hypothetical protein
MRLCVDRKNQAITYKKKLFPKRISLNQDKANLIKKSLRNLSKIKIKLKIYYLMTVLIK